MQVYVQMERMVAGPSFLSKLTSAFATRKQRPNPSAQAKPDVTQAEFWEDCNDVPELAEEASLVDQDFEKVSTDLLLYKLRSDSKSH